MEWSFTDFGSGSDLLLGEAREYGGLRASGLRPLAAGGAAEARRWIHGVFKYITEV